MTVLKFYQTWLLARQFRLCLKWNWWQQCAARAKFESLCTAGQNFFRNYHIWMSVMIQTFHQYPSMTHDNDQISARQVPSVLHDWQIDWSSTVHQNSYRFLVGVCTGLYKPQAEKPNRECLKFHKFKCQISFLQQYRAIHWIYMSQSIPLGFRMPAKHPNKVCFDQCWLSLLLAMTTSFCYYGDFIAFNKKLSW